MRGRVFLAEATLMAVALTGCAAAESGGDSNKDTAVKIARIALAAYQSPALSISNGFNKSLTGNEDGRPNLVIARTIKSEDYSVSVVFSSVVPPTEAPKDIKASDISSVTLTTSHPLPPTPHKRVPPPV